MSKRLGIVSRDILTSAPLPKNTESYTVISHSYVINTVLQNLHDKGFQVIEEQYRCSKDAQVALGIFQIQYGEDPDLNMMFVFANSYDKSMRFKCAIGGYVKTSSMSIITSNVTSWGRKHTGTADDETADTIQHQIENAKVYFQQLLSDKESMKHIKLTKRQFSELIGALYIELELFTGEQMKIIREEFNNSSYDYNADSMSLWTLYNHIQVALSKSHPRNWIEQQKIIHLHLLTEYNLSQFDDETDVVENASAINQQNNVDNPDTIVHSSDDNSESANVITEDELSNQLFGVDNDPESVIYEEDVQEEKNDSIDDSQEHLETLDQSFGLPGYGQPTNEEMNKTEFVTETETTPANEVLETYSESTTETISDFSSEPEDIFIAKSDMFQINPEAKEGSSININDESYMIIKKTVMDETEGFYIRAEINVENTQEVKQEPTTIAIENEKKEKLVEYKEENKVDWRADAVFIAKAELPNNIVGESVKLQGYFMEIVGESLDQFVLIPIQEAVEMEKTAVEFGDLNVKKEEDLIVNSQTIKPEQALITEPEKSNDLLEICSRDEDSAKLDKIRDDKIRTVISQEIYEIYGSFVEYDYTLEDGQYNVTLNTGEVLVLLQNEIDKKANV